MKERFVFYLKGMVSKRLASVFLIAFVCMSVFGQTLNVQMGQVVYQIPAAQAGEMVYQDGKTVTILNKEYTLSEITQIYIDKTEVTDNTVNVNYDGTSATVFVAGNIAQFVSSTVSGAHVSITQSDDVAEEITYILSGTSTDGSLTLLGSFKTTISLNGVSLTNPSGAAIEIGNKKRIQISAKKDTENTLTDGSNGSQKGCIYSKGQIQLQGNGTLSVYGNTAHAIKCGDYVTVKNLTLNVKSAVKDGINCNKYFLMKSGILNVSGVGDDAIQCELEEDDATTAETEDHEDENSANIYIEGGTLSLTATGTAAKCMKTSATVRIDGGDLTLKASGVIDLSDTTDPAYTAGIKAGNFIQNDGKVQMNITGTAGRGVSADNITTNGGALIIVNSGAGQQGSSDSYTAKGLKGENIALNAGTITITMSGTGGKGIRVGSGTATSSGMSTKYTNVTGSYTQGLSDGTGPVLTITTTGSSLGSSSSGGGNRPGGGGGWPGGGGQSSSGSSAKAIKAICAVVIYGGTTEVSTKTNGAEGLESKTSVDIRGGKHYFACYDDCINSAGKIYFNGGVTVCYSNGNDAVDSNAGTTGAITIGDGVAFAYTTKGSPEEGFDCDNNSYIQITGTGIVISAGASQGGGGGWGGSGNTISNAKQGYAFVTSSISYQSGRYYTLSNSAGDNLVTYSFPASCSSSLSLFTATGMVSGSTYYVKYSTAEPADATTAWHGLYLGSSHQGSTSVTSFTAK